MSTNTTESNSSYESTITLTYGKLKDAIYWCENNCIDKWNFIEDPEIKFLPNMHPYSNDYIFKFNNERDYVAFTLVYS